MAAQIDQDVLKNMEKRRPYEDTVTDLLRLIRNVGAHYGGKPQCFKEIIQNPSQYFVDRFPDLTFYVYEHLRRVDRGCFWVHSPQTTWEAELRTFRAKCVGCYS
ncbi:unnamed protein product [Caretta caretta]